MHRSLGKLLKSDRLIRRWRPCCWIGTVPFAVNPSVDVSVADSWRTSVVGHEGHCDLFGNHVGSCFHSELVFSWCTTIPLVRSEGLSVVGQYFQLEIDVSFVTSWMRVMMKGFSNLVLFSQWSTIWLSDQNVTHVTYISWTHEAKRAAVKAAISSSSGRVSFLFVGATCDFAMASDNWFPWTR